MGYSNDVQNTQLKASGFVEGLFKVLDVLYAMLVVYGIISLIAVLAGFVVWLAFPKFIEDLPPALRYGAISGALMLCMFIVCENDSH